MKENAPRLRSIFVLEYRKGRKGFAENAKKSLRTLRVLSALCDTNKLG